MISLRKVSKKFKLYKNPSDRVLEWLHLGRRHEDFYALRNVNLEIPRGRTVGIVGSNGAGKSTLLKLITGVLLPSEGTIEVSGRVAALLELGTGFHPEFTGRQNIHINGQLLGLTPDEIARLEPEIIAFSELGRFIDLPIRTYSSGMILRLGFSVAASIDPELLIVDEALSVGDARFSQKCIRRIREFRERGTTILFVSHDPGAVSLLCDEAILLDKGVVRSWGSPKDILEEYNALQAAQGSGNVEMQIMRPRVDDGAPRRHGTFQALIGKLELCDGKGRPCEVFHPGEEMRLRLRVNFLTDVRKPSIGFMIRDRLGLDLYGTNTALQRVSLEGIAAGEYVDLDVALKLELGYGDYSLTVAVHEDETHLESCYEWTDNAAVFRVRLREKPQWSGLFRMEPRFKVKRGRSEDDEVAGSLEERFGEVPDPLPMDPPPPAPFLFGFEQAQPGERGIFRHFASSSRFMFRSKHRWLALKVAVADAMEGAGLRLSTSCGLLLGEYAVMDGYWLLAAELPEQVVGQLELFQLEWRPQTSGMEPPRFGLYQVESHEQPPESPEWAVLIPAKSSKTLNAS